MRNLLFDIITAIFVISIIVGGVSGILYLAIKDNDRIDAEAHNCFDRGGNVVIHERKVLCSK
jgi:hypothetical protein